MLMLDIAVVNTALSDIAADLNTGLSGLQWVVDAYTLALAAVVLTAGSLADRFGRRFLFTIGLSIFTVASLVCAVGQDIVMLNSFRAVQGVGAAIMFAVSLALLSNAFPSRRAGQGVRGLRRLDRRRLRVGPLVGGALTSGLDWRFIFLVNLPLGLICLAITRRSVEESQDPNARKIDAPGQITLTAGLFLLVFALLRGNDDGWTSATIVASLAGAVTFLAAFIAVEARVKEPMLPLGLFRIRAFTGAQVGGVRDLGVVLRRVHLHDAVPAADPRAVGHRGRPRLPAGHDDHALRLRRDREPRAEVSARATGRRRAAARRRSARRC